MHDNNTNKDKDNCHNGKQATDVKICNLSHVTRLVSKSGHKSGPGYNHVSIIKIYIDIQSGDYSQSQCIYSLLLLIMSANTNCHM